MSKAQRNHLGDDRYLSQLSDEKFLELVRKRDPDTKACVKMWRYVIVRAIKDSMYVGLVGQEEYDKRDAAQSFMFLFHPDHSYADARWNIFEMAGWSIAHNNLSALSERLGFNSIEDAAEFARKLERYPYEFNEEAEAFFRKMKEKRRASSNRQKTAVRRKADRSR